MTYQVTQGQKIRLNETDPVASVLQNVAVILATPKGSCPLYREFGLDGDFIDRPMPAAQAMAYSAIKDAVETFEPRADVLGVTFEEDPERPGRLLPTVEVRIINA